MRSAAIFSTSFCKVFLVTLSFLSYIIIGEDDLIINSKFALSCCSSRISSLMDTTGSLICWTSIKVSSCSKVVTEVNADDIVVFDAGAAAAADDDDDDDDATAAAAAAADDDDDDDAATADGDEDDDNDDVGDSGESLCSSTSIISTLKCYRNCVLCFLQRVLQGSCCSLLGWLIKCIRFEKIR